jgi:hypothetical protein
MSAFPLIVMLGLEIIISRYFFGFNIVRVSIPLPTIIKWTPPTIWLSDERGKWLFVSALWAVIQPANIVLINLKLGDIPERRQKVKDQCR